MVKSIMKVKDEEYYNTIEAAHYLGITRPALNNRVKAYNKKHPDNKIGKWTLPQSRDRFLKKSDLDKLITLHPVD